MIEILSRMAPYAFQRAQEEISKGRAVRVLRFNENNGLLTIKGAVEADFGYFYNILISIDFSNPQNPMFKANCGCYDSQNELMCHHAAMLLIEAVGEERLGLKKSAEPLNTVTVAELPVAEPEKNKEAVLKTASLQVDEKKGAEEKGAEEKDETSLCSFEASQESMAVDESKEPTTMEILFGTEKKTEEAVIWHPNDTDEIMNTNTGIIGTMGTGKTQFTKSLVTQMYQNSKDNYQGTPISVLIFDYKGDYNKNHTDFMKLTNAKVFYPYHFPLNPFQLPLSENNLPALPLHVASAFTSTISKIYNLGEVQKQTLLDCVEQAYLSQGIRPHMSSTWSRKAPTFDTVFKIYDEKVQKKGDSLGSAMKRLQRFEIFEADPGKTCSLWSLLNGVVVLDISQYDPDIQNLVVAITLDLFYSQMKTQKHSKTNGKYRQLTKLLLVDEADNFLGEDFPALRKIIKEGRDFGVGTILSTQSLNHFVTDTDDYSKYIYTWVVHKVPDLKKTDVEYIFGVNAKKEQHSKIYDGIKTLEKHASIVRIGEKITEITDYPFWKLVKDKS